MDALAGISVVFTPTAAQKGRLLLIVHGKFWWASLIVP
jgi:hypothetical protein